MPAPAFAHGGGQGSRVWSETVAALCAQGVSRADVVLLDIPGCGAKRGRDVVAVDANEIAAELVTDVAAAGSSRTILVGHSLAGPVMTRVFELAPERSPGWFTFLLGPRSWHQHSRTDGQRPTG